jgi:hypothetical protein
MIGLGAQSLHSEALLKGEATGQGGGDEGVQALGLGRCSLCSLPHVLAAVADAHEYSEYSISRSPLSANFSTELGRDRVIVYGRNSVSRRSYAGDRATVKTPKTKE